MRLFGSNIGVIVGTSASLASGSISFNEPLPSLQFIYSDPLFTSSLTSGSVANIQTIITTASDIGASGELFIEISDPNNLRSSGSEVIRFTVSESTPRVGIGTKTPSSIFEVKSPSGSSKESPDIVLSVPSGSIAVGSESSRLAFVIEDEQFSGSKLLITGSTAAIYSRVLGQAGLFQYGSLVFEVDGDGTDQRDWPVLEMGYGIIGGKATQIGTVLSSSLEIGGGQTGPQFKIKSSAGETIAELGYDSVIPPAGDDDAGALALYNDGVEEIRFTTTKANEGGPSDRVSYISSSGNFGLGTKSPNEKLGVIGNISASGAVTASTAVFDNIPAGSETTFITVDSSGNLKTRTSGADGTSGTSGASGTSGTSGASGTSGTSGADGTSGTSGADGANGTSGTSGASGTSGTSGASGTSGTSGTDGTSGTSGTDGTDGTSGTSGADGTSGTSGTSGSDGINTTGFRIEFESTTTNSDPGSGKFKFNNSDPALATAVYISETDLDGLGVQPLLDELTTSTNSNKSVIAFRLESNQIYYDTAYVTAQTDNGGWRTLTISHIDKNGWVNVSDGDAMFMSISIIGDVGDSGTSGTSGADGANGTSGTSGTDGADGTSGTSGTDGTSGTSGVSGTSGTSGADGANGTSGTSGADGANGTSGTSGASGTSGTSGTDGADGTSGTSGTDGTSGTSGVSGTSGTSGASGTSGTSGADGANGTSGTSGADGANGTSGTSGADGANGTSGTSGADGANGTSGTSGADGANGTSGTSGVSGTSGTSGATGTSGTSGADGTLTLTGTTDNGVITLNGTAPNATVESNLVFTGTSLTLTTAEINLGTNNYFLQGKTSLGASRPIIGISNNDSVVVGNSLCDIVLTGDVTASNAISASGGITAEFYYLKDKVAIADSAGTLALGFDDTPISIGKVENTINIIGPITASSTISGSIIFGDTGSFSYLTGKSPLVIENTDGITFKSSSVLNEVNGTKIQEVTKASDLPTTLADNTTYVIRGNVTIPGGSEVTAGQFNAIIGLDRDKDKLTYSGTGNFITVTDETFLMQNLGLSSTNANSCILSASNVAASGYNNSRDEFLSIINCQFRNVTGNVMDVKGFDLVDFNNTTFFYCESPDFGCKFQDVSKLEISSCEFIRWFRESSIPTPAGYATCPMIELDVNNHASFGAVNISGCIIHPQATQFGILINSGSTTGFGTIAANAFVNVGLTTGGILGQSTYDSGSMLKYDVFGNQGLENSSAEAFITVTGNTTATVLGRGNEVQVDFGANENVRSIQRFGFDTVNEYITYKGSKDIKVLIAGTLVGEKSGGGSETYTIDLQLDDGGGFDPIPGSSTEFTTSGGTVSITKNLIVNLSQNDNLAFFIRSAGGDDFTAQDLQLTITEV